MRRALRIEDVVSEVTELKGHLQRIGARLAALRAELVTLGADPAVVPVVDAGPAAAAGPSARRAAAASPGTRRAAVVDATGADFAADGWGEVDLVPVDLVWGR